MLAGFTDEVAHLRVRRFEVRSKTCVAECVAGGRSDAGDHTAVCCGEPCVSETEAVCDFEHVYDLLCAGEHENVEPAGDCGADGVFKRGGVLRELPTIDRDGNYAGTLL